MDRGKGVGVHMADDSKGLREKYCWTDERTKLLISIGRECSRNGQKVNTNFTKAGWAWMLQEYNKKCEKKVTKMQLKNKWNVLKGMWNGWLYLKNKTDGWGWNMDLGILELPSKEHWDDYVKRFPHGKHLKDGPLEYEEELQELFQGPAVDGDGTICTTENEPRPTTPNVVSASNSAVNLNPDDSSDDDLPIELSDMTKNKKQKRSSMASSKRSKSSDCIGEALEKLIALETHRVAGMAAYINSKKVDINGEKIDTTFEKAYKILDTLDGIEIGSNHHVVALEVLEDRNKRQAFISMNGVARLPWLLRAIERKIREESGSLI